VCRAQRQQRSSGPGGRLTKKLPPPAIGSTQKSRCPEPKLRLRNKKQRVFGTSFASPSGALPVHRRSLGVPSV